MRKWVIVGIALMVGVLSLGVPGWAQDGGEWGPGFREGGGPRVGKKLMAMLESDRVKAALGLTDQQTDRLREIMVETRKSSVKSRADLAIRGIELHELLRVDKPDRETVMKKVQEISDLGRESMRQHIDALLAAKSVLTPEQQKKIRTFIESRGGPGFGRERFMERRPSAPGRPGAPPQPRRNPNEPPTQ